MDPSWSSEKPSLASKVPEIPINRLFYGDIRNMVNSYLLSNKLIKTGPKGASLLSYSLLFY